MVVVWNGGGWRVGQEGREWLMRIQIHLGAEPRAQPCGIADVGTKPAVQYLYHLRSVQACT